MREQLLEGKKIRLGDLGDFSILLTSKGAEDADKFTAQNITDKNRIKMSKMKADTWKTILQIAISILTALATSLGVSSCMG